MQIYLSEEQEMILETVRDLVNEKIKPKARYYDETGEFPHQNIDSLKEIGILGMNIEEKYGGINANILTYAVVLEEISRGCASTATTIAGSNSLAATPIQKYGNDYIKETFLPLLTTHLGAFGLSESHAGSDAAALSTRAIRDGDEFVINGSKTFITNAEQAKIVVLFARSLDIPGYKGISAFVVPTETEGFNILPHEKKMGIRASATNALSFEELRIPKENIIGEEGKGLNIALSTLNSGRIAVAAQSVGIAQAAYEAGLKYAKEREQFGKSISNYQSIQMMLAEMTTKITYSRLLYYHAAKLHDAGLPYIKEAAMAKWVGSETATFCAHRAIQIHGGNGYINEFEVERLYRDARITEIYEGTSEIMQMIISREELK